MRPRRSRPSTAPTALLAVLASVLVLTATTAAPAAVTTPVSTGNTASSSTTAAPPGPGAVQAFLDERVPEILDEHDVPGAGVTAVADGEVIVSEGYGHADLAASEPIDPDLAVFPTASVAKSFTAALALQLVEQGDLDLREDVNTYLPEEAHLPDTFPGEPVTLHHLLTHTAGFDDRLEGSVVDSLDRIPPLSAAGRHEVPLRYPPGRWVSYSNYGTVVVGLLVQEVGGAPFPELARTRLFEPLGMDRTAFRGGETSGAPGEPVVQHRPDGLAHPEQYYPAAAPGGDATTTLEDMARFMIALLDSGRVDGEQVLSPRVADMLLERRHTLDERIRGAGYGTWEQRRSPRAVGHEGDLGGIHTSYTVVPDLGIGLFVGINGDEGEASGSTSPYVDARMAVRDAFLDEFAPQDGDVIGEAAPEDDLSRYAGVYSTSRSSSVESSRVRELLDRVDVHAGDDGALRLSGLADPAPGERWLPAGQGVFVSEESRQRLVFVEEDGRAAGLVLDVNVTQTYVAPESTLTDPGTHTVVALASLGLLLSVLVWPVTALVRRLLDRWEDTPRGARVARAAAVLTALSVLASTGVLVHGFLDPDLENTWMMTNSPVPAIGFTLTLVPALAGLVMTVVAWVRGWWSVPGRIHHTAVVLAGAAFLSVARYYHLVWTPFS